MPNSKLFWFKLKTSFLTSNAVNYFMTLPGRCEYVTFYQALTLTTLNTNGVLMYKIGKISREMDEQYLSQSCKFWDKDFIKNAIQLYLDIELLKIDNNGFKYIVDFEDNIGSEWTSTLNRREKKKVEKEGSKRYPKKVANATKKGEQMLPELDKDLDKDLDKEVESKKLEKLNTSFDKSDTSDKSDKATRPLPIGPATGFLEALIRKKYITQNDPEIDDYNYLFEDLINEFKDYSLIYQCLSYVISYSKNSKIDNRLAYLKTAITDGLKKVTQFSDGNTLEDIMKKFMHDHDIKLEDMSHVN